MPRPKKYASEAERLEARRLQVRKNVEAFRQRKKQNHAVSDSQVPTLSRPSNASTNQHRHRTRSSDIPQPWPGNQNSMSHTDLLHHQYDTDSWYTSSNRGNLASSDSSESDRNQTTRDGSPVELDFTDLSLDFGQEFEADFGGFLSAENSSYTCNPFAIDPLLVDQEYAPAVPLVPKQYDAAEMSPPDEGPREIPSSGELQQEECDDPEEVIVSEYSSLEGTRSVVSTVALYPSPYNNFLPSIDKLTMTFEWLANESARDGFGDNRSCWPWHCLRDHYVGCSKKANRLLEVAMVACCGVLAGQMRSDTNLLNTAQEAYHRTVHQLRKQLGGVEDSENSLLKQNAMILVTATWAVMVEKIYKCIFEAGTDGAGWTTHMCAIQDIVRLAGPKAFQSAAGIRILRWTYACLLAFDDAGMIRSFVDTDAWRNVPYELDGKSWQDRILILAHRVQTVIHRAKEAIQHQHVDPDQAIAVWRDMAILKHALHAWYDAYEVDTVDQERNMNVGTSVNGRPLFWTRPTTGILSEDIWTLPEMIEYRDAEVAETLSFYFLCLFRLSTNALELQENVLDRFPLAYSSLTAFPLLESDLLSAERDIMPTAYHILGTVEEIDLRAMNMHQFSCWHGTYTVRAVAKWLLKESHIDKRKRDILIWLRPVQEATGERSAFGALGMHITNTMLGSFPELPAWEPVEEAISQDMMCSDAFWLKETLTMRDFELRPC